LHSHFNQALTTTGRLSSNEPNLQNIPIRTVEGAKVREAFVASKGNKLLGADYSQIELRVLAHYTGDAGLTRAFADDVDVHAVTASEVFGVKLGDVTSEQRRTAKAINFGIAYGQGAFGLAENLGISRAEAQDIIKKYFIKFSGVKTYIEDMTASVHEKGFVTTLFGRKRFIEEVKSQNVNIRKFGERAAINAPIQGTAADIVKKAMIDLFQQTKSKMILQVHDELIFEGSPAELESEKSVIVSKMQDCAKLNVPLKVNSAVGDNWAELK
jgi:DNA polymerase-1